MELAQDGRDCVLDAAALYSFQKSDDRMLGNFEMRSEQTIAAFNLLAKWRGLEPGAAGVVHLSIAEFSL